MTSSVTLTAADLFFDPATHTTRTPDGRDVPHVTHILQAVGVSTNFEEIGAMSSKHAQAIEERRALGTCVHADCHAFDDDAIVWSTVDSRVLPYIEAWDICRQNTGLIPITRERQVYHPLHGYTGILDGIFAQPSRGKVVLVDLKIGDPEDAGAQFQTAAYESAYLCEHPDTVIHERWAVKLDPSLSVPYRIKNYSAEPDSCYLDFQKFCAFLTTYREQRARRRAA